MLWYHYLLISLGGVLVLLIAIILIKAATFKDTTDYFKKVDVNLKLGETYNEPGYEVSNKILNDKVSFKINDRGDAEITSIINRKIRDVTCKVVSNGKKKKIECFYRGIDVKLPSHVLNDFKDGDIILLWGT